MKAKSYKIGTLKVEPINRVAELGDVVQWINTLQITFYAIVVKIENDIAEFRNYYDTVSPYYCFSSDFLSRLVVLDMFLTNEKNEKIGNVSKNVTEAFLKNQIQLNENVWYELKNNQPRIHRKNLICKI